MVKHWLSFVAATIWVDLGSLEDQNSLMAAN